MPYSSVENLGHGTVLVFAPHPDDEVFGCGGAIMSHVDNGDPVYVVIVTDGGYQLGEKIDEQAYIECRQQESIKAAGILGYGTPVFWGLPDRGITYNESMIQRILQAIEETGANIVYAPSTSEMHPDHRAVGIAVEEAARRCTRRITLSMYEIGVPLSPNLLLDITGYVDRKKRAMLCFYSQLKNQNYVQQIEALNVFRTYTLPRDAKAAEAYRITETGEA